MLTTNQMYSTKITNIKKNYYGLLSIDDDDDTDDITIVTSNKSTNSTKRPEHKPATNGMQSHIQIAQRRSTSLQKQKHGDTSFTTTV